MDIRTVRATLGEALSEVGLSEERFVPGGPKVWTLPGPEVIRYFNLQGYRRPWGFVVDGHIGIEIPELRSWLRTHRRPKEMGVFHDSFAFYHTANDAALNNFMIEMGKPIPSDLWAGLIHDRLAALPDTISELIRAYQGNKERLGWLAHPTQRHAWQFLLKWRECPDPSLAVPQRLPNGRIV